MGKVENSCPRSFELVAKYMRPSNICFGFLELEVVVLSDFVPEKWAYDL